MNLLSDNSSDFPFWYPTEYCNQYYYFKQAIKNLKNFMETISYLCVDLLTQKKRKEEKTKESKHTHRNENGNLLQLNGIKFN